MTPEGSQEIIGVLSNFGTSGLFLFFMWLGYRRLHEQDATHQKETTEKDERHRKEIIEILAMYKGDMVEMRKMYESNVSLVKRFSEISEDLKEVVILNTQAWQKASDNIVQNQFCPHVRIEKRAVGREA